MKTLAQITEAHGFEVLEHLEADLEVPVNDGLQAQGDLLVVPFPGYQVEGTRAAVPAEGIAVIEAVGSGHEHRLFAGTPGTAWFTPGSHAGMQDIGVLECTEPAYLLHPEHGATGIGPQGTFALRRQREQADEERLVAD